MVTLEISVGLITSAVLTVLVTWVGWHAVRAWLSWRKFVAHMMKLPQENPHWLFGTLKDFPGPNEEGLAYIRKKVPEVAGLGCAWYGPFHSAASIHHPVTIKAILKTSEPKPAVNGPYCFAKPWLGDGLLIAHGRKWARNRKLLTPAFHFDILRPYITVNNECVDVFLKRLIQFSDQKVAFNAAEHISHVTLDILLRCAFSHDNDVQTRGSEHPYVKAVEEMTHALVHRLLSPWLYPDFIYFNLTSAGWRFKRNCNYVHTVSSDIIHARRQTLEAGRDGTPTQHYLDFLDILLTARDDQGQGLTEQEIQDEADTFLFEGHDTTASGIMWALYSLASHPEIQKRCQEEVDGILDGRSSQHILWEDLPHLSYLSMCIKEALRLHVPVPVIQRQLTDDLTVDGHFLPYGTIIDIHLYGLHHNSNVWKDSMKYDPDRFTVENMAKMDPHAFLPFSAGPRNCIGQNFAMHEMKVVIGRIIHSFTLEMAPDRPPVRHAVDIIMRTENGMYLNVIPRQPATT